MTHVKKSLSGKFSKSGVLISNFFRTALKSSIIHDVILFKENEDPSSSDLDLDVIFRKTLHTHFGRTEFSGTGKHIGQVER